jgi:hypothetical protein
VNWKHTKTTTTTKNPQQQQQKYSETQKEKEWVKTETYKRDIDSMNRRSSM